MPADDALAVLIAPPEFCAAIVEERKLAVVPAEMCLLRKGAHRLRLPSALAGDARAKRVVIDKPVRHLPTLPDFLSVERIRKDIARSGCWRRAMYKTCRRRYG